LVAKRVMAAIDQCGGRDGKEALGFLDRRLELELKIRGPTSEGEEGVVVLVRALVVRHARKV
jgi:hypothetical protein